MTMLVALNSTPALGEFAQAWASVHQYTATIQLYEQKGTNTEHAVFAYTFTKPSSLTMHVQQGPNSGATVVWSGSKTVVATKTGAFGISGSKTVSLHDSLVTSIRGSTVKDLSFGSILAHAKKTPGTIEQGPGVIADQPVDVVTLTVTDPSKDRGLTREILYLSKATHFPVRVDGYDGSQLVQSLQFAVTASK